MNDEIYQAAFDDELHKIAALGGFAGTVAKGAKRMGSRFLRKTRRLPRSLPIRGERIKRGWQQSVLAQKARVSAKSGSTFAMGNPRDITAAMHQENAAEHFRKSGLTRAVRGAVGLGVLGTAGIAINKRQAAAKGQKMRYI